MVDLSKFSTGEFERGASLIKELLWWLCRCLFFAHSLPVPSVFKVVLLRAFGAKVGEGVVIRSAVNITFPWRVTLGDHVWIGDEVMFLSLDEVRVGSHVCISQRAFLCTGSHDSRQESFDLITKPIVIKDGVWICASSFVAPGVTMAESSMCTPGSVVVKDVQTAIVVGGNPAKFIKKRYET
ncbi:WcaF family extracellular polysaccharide biosynthesis acetyltransferase [Rubritalea sp.]|uniref:WcaF family extracellular polysaccharide biosynthesis acetyltransferase n=1 Tax=Rubritalea sp. TaxID=2109375 RepID=UPI003EF9BEEC